MAFASSIEQLELGGLWKLLLVANIAMEKHVYVGCSLVSRRWGQQYSFLDLNKRLGKECHAAHRAPETWAVDIFVEEQHEANALFCLCKWEEHCDAKQYPEKANVLFFFFPRCKYPS